MRARVPAAPPRLDQTYRRISFTSAQAATQNTAPSRAKSWPPKNPAGKYLPGSVGGIAVFVRRVLQDAQAPRGEQLHGGQLDPGGGQVAFQQTGAGQPGLPPHSVHQAEQPGADRSRMRRGARR